MKRLIGRSALALAIMLSAGVLAAGNVNAGDRGQHGKPDHEFCEAKKHGDHAHYGEWKKTLTDAQKEELKKLHVEMKKELASLEAKVHLKKSELKNIVASDGPDRVAFARLIDEVSALKKEALKTRYEHMIKVRSLLTPEQKAAFDLSVLSKDGYGHEKGW